MENNTENKSPLGNLSQTQMFVFGIIAGVLVLCTIGFFITLGMVLKGDNINTGINEKVAEENGGNEVVPTNNKPSPSGKPAPVDEKTDNIKGGKNAKVTLIEYSDFECSFCSRFVPSVEQALEEYGGDIRVVYRHFPLSFHLQAMPSALASECAAEQGKFWEFHDKLFDNQGSLGADFYKKTATELGLNMTKFNDCVSSEKYKSEVQAQQADGVKAGVQGTPHTFVIGKDGTVVPVSGAQPFSSLKAAIDSVL
jgi:protein-disulfide isomerase